MGLEEVPRSTKVVHQARAARDGSHGADGALAQQATGRPLAAPRLDTLTAAVATVAYPPGTLGVSQRRTRIGSAAAVEATLSGNYLKKLLPAGGAAAVTAEQRGPASRSGRREGRPPLLRRPRPDLSVSVRLAYVNAEEQQPADRSPTVSAGLARACAMEPDWTSDRVWPGHENGTEHHAYNQAALNSVKRIESELRRQSSAGRTPKAENYGIGEIFMLVQNEEEVRRHCSTPLLTSSPARRNQWGQVTSSAPASPRLAYTASGELRRPRLLKRRSPTTTLESELRSGNVQSPKWNHVETFEFSYRRPLE